MALKCTVVELGTWNRQTDGETDRSVANAPPAVDGGIKIRTVRVML